MPEKTFDGAHFAALVITTLGAIEIIGSGFLFFAGLEAWGLVPGLDAFIPFLVLFVPGLLTVGIGFTVDLLSSVAGSNERISGLLTGQLQNETLIEHRSIPNE